MSFSMGCVYSDELYEHTPESQPNNKPEQKSGTDEQMPLISLRKKLDKKCQP